MNVIGIVVEYNPFHNGHLYQINKVKGMFPNSIIIVVMSSSFTQRGEVSILDKWSKTEIALNYGIDLIVELPYVYSTQSADTFAYYSIKILNELKIDTLVFGSESADIDKLIKIASSQINNEELNNKVKTYLKSGLNYPTSLSNAINDLINLKVDTSNDILAISYIKAILEINNNINIKPILRNNEYKDKFLTDKIISATKIREKNKNKEEVKNYVPSLTYKYIKNINIDYDKYFSLLKYKILSENNLSQYLDVDKDIESTIKSSILISNNLESLINNIKSKRYTFNRINRMLNHIFVGFTKEDKEKFKELDYIRILGFSYEGKRHLNKIKKDLNMKLLSKFNKNYELLKYELKVTKLYSIIVNDEKLIKEEYQSTPIYCEKR
jgi:cytidyltransferase-like protein